MRFFDLFFKYYAIEKKLDFGFFPSLKNSCIYAFRTQNHHYNLIRDFKMTPGFYLANRYFSKSHDAASVGLQHRLFIEMKKKQAERSEINTKAIDFLIATSRFPEYAMAPRLRSRVSKIAQIVRKTQRYIINETEIKRPPNIKEKMQDLLLYSVRLYHESLQNLIEGQREVLRDKKFMFEDNKTVEDRMQAFEEYLKNKIPRLRRKKQTNEGNDGKNEKEKENPKSN